MRSRHFHAAFADVIDLFNFNLDSGFGWRRQLHQFAQLDGFIIEGGRRR